MPMNPDHELLKGNTPTLVLAVLKEQQLHGYAIAREIERRSSNVLRCKEGTLYPTLHALERDRLVTGAWEKDDRGRNRKVYTITAAGLTALDHGRQTWTNFASAIEQVLGDISHEEISTPKTRTGILPNPAV